MSTGRESHGLGAEWRADNFGLMSVFPSIVLVSYNDAWAQASWSIHSGVRDLPSRIAEIILLADSKAAVTACLSVSYTEGEW